MDQTAVESSSCCVNTASFGAFIPGWRKVCLVGPDGNIREIRQGDIDHDKLPNSNVEPASERGL
jgi:hypothetical protein